jgi:hypothetical protein
MTQPNYVCRTIDIANYDEIHQELVQYALAQAPRFTSAFNHLSVPLVMAHCGYLDQWFRSQNLVPRVCVLIIQPPGADHRGAHTDTIQDMLALNFGIANCLHTWCAFYKLKSGEPVIKSLPPGPAWYQYPDAELALIGTCNLVKPTLINVAVPHAVHNPTDAVRISVSFRFLQNPWHLA